MLCAKYHSQIPTGKCLQEEYFQKLVNLLYPNGLTCKKCRKITLHRRVKRRRAYACEICFTQTYPLAQTIFHRSRTCLTDWYSAFQLLTSAKSGISAKTLSRVVKVTHKTAWKMLTKIRGIMFEDIGKLKGVVEVDETYINKRTFFKWGRTYWSNAKRRPSVIVMGFVERKGRLKAFPIKDTSRWAFHNLIKLHVEPSSWVITDSHQGYDYLEEHGYRHDSVNHMETYVDKKNPLVHTQTIEGAWSQIKRGIYAVYRRVRQDFIPLYLNEFVFRYNHRNESSEVMMDILLKKVKTTIELPS